jgi:hypothetical protein
MNYIIIGFIVLSFSITNLIAQSFPGDVDPDKSSVNSDETEGTGSFLGLDYKISKINSQQANQLGLSVGGLLNRSLGIGISYFSLLGTNVKVNFDQTLNRAISLEYGGFSVDYSFFPVSWIRVGAGGVLSLGRMSVSSSDISGIRNYSQSDWLGIIEPKIFAGINVFSNIWICASYWYMLPFGVDFYDIRNSSFNSGAFGIGIYTF